MKQVKKVLSVMLVLVMALGLFTGCKKEPEPKVDTSWYKDSETTFTLTKANQLMGLAELAKENNFEGKTIKLGKDIVLNKFDEAILAKWRLGSVEPENIWTPLGNEDLPFAGKIDGQGHKISGLYVSGEVKGTGFIGRAAYSVELTNIKFVGGYIKNTLASTGLIGFGVVSKIENVYTNLFMESYANGIGGFIGSYVGGYAAVADGEAENWVKSNMKINNCWFDGTITGGGYGFGGCIGIVESKRTKVEITNFLSTGKFMPTREDNACKVGGVFGWPNASAIYIIQNSISAFTLESPYTGSDNTVGAMVGQLGGSGLSIVNSYGTGDKAVGIANSSGAGYVAPEGTIKTLDELKALDIATALPKLEGETASPWQAVSGSHPVLKGVK